MNQQRTRSQYKYKGNLNKNLQTPVPAIQRRLNHFISRLGLKPLSERRFTVGKIATRSDKDKLRHLVIMSKIGSTMTPTIFLIVVVSLISLDVCHAKNNIIDISRKGVFNAAVLRNQKPVVVYFTKSSCSQCNQILRELETIAKANDEKMYLARADLDQFPNLWKEFEIRTVPTTKTYFRGEKLREVQGPLVGPIRAITNNAIKYGEENSKKRS